MSEIKLFAVTGKPVFFSRSPDLFNCLFRAFGINAFYTRLAAESAEEALSVARAIGLSGLNITSPFKEDIIPFLDGLDKHALGISAVNCVVNRRNCLTGYNTDFAGAVRALEKNGVKPENKKVVILGAGGAAKAAVYGLLRSGAKSVIVMNRTPERAKELSRLTGCDYAPLENADDILGQSDILISCIPSYQRIIKPDFLKKGLVVMDANYTDSSFIHESSYKGYKIVNGLDWLCYQAFPAFHLFTCKKVSGDLEKKIVRDAFKEKSDTKPNIALIGLMGAGKTTVGRLLAKKMEYGFLEIDRIIEKLSGLTIPEIFRKKGEEFFREIERSVIAEQILGAKGKIFSLGGGAIRNEENHRVLKQNCYIVWLWVLPKTAIKRIDVSSRPLLNHSNPEEAADRILKARVPLYAKASDMVISTESKSPREIARRIKNEMDQTLKD